MNTILGPNTRVKWLAANPDGWAGDGSGVLVNFDQSRAYFGAKKGSGKDTPGPAYEVQLDGGHRVWAAPDEVVAA